MRTDESHGEREYYIKEVTADDTYGRRIQSLDCGPCRAIPARAGKGIIHTISKDLQRKLPHIKGLTEKNIYYCKRWYSLYNNEFQKLPQPVGKSDGSEFPKVIAEFFSIPGTHLYRYSPAYLYQRMQQNNASS